MVYQTVDANNMTDDVHARLMVTQGLNQRRTKSCDHVVNPP